MKKIILLIFLIFLFSFAYGESKVEELLKSDKEVYKELSIDKKSTTIAKTAYVEKINGQAFIQNAGSEIWIQAVAKSEIKEKTTIITMEKTSIKIRLADGSFVNIGAKTKAYFEKMRGEPDKESLSETGIKLFWGKIYSNVKKKVESGGKYEVKTGSVVAGVRGTKYMVSAEKSGENEITVYEGIVAVNKIGEKIEILINKNEKIKLINGKFEIKKEHNEQPPEESIKDNSIIERIKEQILENEIEKENITSENRDINNQMVTDMVKLNNTGNSKTILNITVK